MTTDAVAEARRTALEGGPRQVLGTKLPVRERLRLLLDPGSFVEDGLLANATAGTFPADGVVTGVGRVDGRAIAVIAHDPTVKAGSWGGRTVEKQIRILERADRNALPVFYLVDSAGGRLSEQLAFFAGRRGASRIFHLQVALSGRVPQICCLFGPSAAGGAYMPAFTDWVAMVDGNASMSLASPRVAASVNGERTTLEEMGGATLHTTQSGCADLLCVDDAEAIEQAKCLFSFLPRCWDEPAPVHPATAPEATDWTGVLPDDPRRAYDMHRVIERIVDADSFFEIKPRWASELITGLGRLCGCPVGIVANQPLVRSGAIFVDSADKAARFITLCDAFNIPLVFLHDVPGFMIGVDVERQGIIRHGAKMIAAMSSAQVPKLSVVVRKAYAAGYYAMCAPGFEPAAIIALPTANIAAMGAEAAISAMYDRRLAQLPADEAELFRAERIAEYEREVDLVHLAAELVVDAVVEPHELRRELAERIATAVPRGPAGMGRHHGVFPV